MGMTQMLVSSARGVAVVRRGLIGSVMLTLVAIPAATQAAPHNVCLPDTGLLGRCGDGGPATKALLGGPRDVAVLPSGGFLIADDLNHDVRRVSTRGRITTVAGASGVRGFSGDGARARPARLNEPSAVAATPDGGFLIADSGNHRIRKVSRRGRIKTIAGRGKAGFDGDGGRAKKALLSSPSGIAVMPDGGFLIADSGNHRVRLVSAAGTITTVAGTGFPQYSGDGAPATAAALNTPTKVDALAGGGFLIADSGNNRIRRVWPWGTITTVAGSGRAFGDLGDGGPATAATLYSPTSVSATADGRFLIADNYRIREVSALGTINTVAGGQECTSTGDGGRAADARFAMPHDVQALSSGGFLVAEFRVGRVRLVAANGLVDTVAGGGGRPAALPVDIGGLCGASPNYSSKWNAFSIARVTVGRRQVVIRYHSTLPARVSAKVIRRRGKPARARSQRKGAGRKKIIVRGRFRRGRRYVVVVEGRHGKMRRKDVLRLG